MSSVDARIKRRAEMYERAQETFDAERLKDLRDLLREEVYNMWKRYDAHKQTDSATNWLHSKSFDETYQDYGPLTKQYRTRVRFENLLTLCWKDEKRLLREYARALNAYFPIANPRFEWAPRLVRTDSGRLTVVHRWALTRA